MTRDECVNLLDEVIKHLELFMGGGLKEETRKLKRIKEYIERS